MSFVNLNQSKQPRNLRNLQLQVQLFRQSQGRHAHGPEAQS